MKTYKNLRQLSQEELEALQVEETYSSLMESLEGEIQEGEVVVRKANKSCCGTTILQLKR